MPMATTRSRPSSGAGGVADDRLRPRAGASAPRSRDARNWRTVGARKRRVGRPASVLARYRASGGFVAGSVRYRPPPECSARRRDGRSPGRSVAQAAAGSWLAWTREPQTNRSRNRTRCTGAAQAFATSAGSTRPPRVWRHARLMARTGSRPALCVPRVSRAPRIGPGRQRRARFSVSPGCGRRVRR